MLFLMRPRQTYMPYALPRDPKQLHIREEQRERAFKSTLRVPPPVPASDPVAALKNAAALHESGALTDDEFQTVKARLLESDES